MVNSLAKYRASQCQVSSNLCGSTILLNHRKGTYYELNEVGTTIWERLKTESVTFEELKALILDDYDVDVSVATNDLEKIINELLHEKLLEIA
ncbi:PqqD family protein [Lacihabitans soyangensis]|jgi:hypothetical protein|uniref:PqqD family protein n=1 Tax=Lacihabitans soyangensis TaxID=869394 RepID=A0AAE3H0Z2_9BACT|nr:PqqD family protein [Lacihabitans soyangensis]MCP9762947.1 PqqD family protein [Lacihabitans soyangensis]